MIDKQQMIDERLSEVLTQYRESPKLKGMISVYLGVLADIAIQNEQMLSAFDLDSSIGDQLTMIGKWLGWPREHCQGQRAAHFGFERDGSCTDYYPVKGFCEDGYFSCGVGSDFEEFEFDDDSVYRKWLKARAIKINSQKKRDFRRENLVEACQEIFGNGVEIVSERKATLTICIPRAMTDQEMATSHLLKGVLPVPPGVGFSIANSPSVPFGFGPGWGELCNSSFYATVRDNLERAPKSDIFGFGQDFSGLCEGSFYSGNPQDLE